MKLEPILYLLMPMEEIQDSQVESLANENPTMLRAEVNERSMGEPKNRTVLAMMMTKA